jgi:hypothetical protein
MEQNFLPGLQLNKLFYKDVVGPLMKEHFSRLPYSAGLVGHGSDVLGYDTPRSMDHNWGPHLHLFFTEEDFSKYKDKVDTMLRQKLPYSYMGFSTNFTRPNNSYLAQRPVAISSGEVNHLFEFWTIESFFKFYIGFDPHKNITLQDWLTFPQQPLLEVTEGELYHDDLGVQKIRDKFAYYPEEVWLYIYTIQWDMIGSEESLPGRTGEMGDELGSQIIATDIVFNIMKLCFLMEKKYWPYIKWFGTAFSRLEAARELEKHLLNVLRSSTWEERDYHLGSVYTIIAKMHNALKVTKQMHTSTQDFHGRPYTVIHGLDFYDELAKNKKNTLIHQLKYKIGAIDQFVGHPKINHRNQAHRALRSIIQ